MSKDNFYDYIESFIEDYAVVSRKKHWGFINRDRVEIIPCIYDYVENFSEGLAVAKKNDKYGFIDKTGKKVIPFKYECCRSFIEGFAPFQKDGKWGYLDKSGNEVIPATLDSACFFFKGVASVKINNHWGYINTNGQTLPLEYREFYEDRQNIYDLPDDAFGNELVLNLIRYRFNNQLEHNLEMCHNDKNLDQLKEYYLRLSEYIKDKAYEAFLKAKNNESQSLKKEKNDIKREFGL